jgi:hypothetical protein
MGQFSMTISAVAGSVLSDNQQIGLHIENQLASLADPTCGQNTMESNDSLALLLDRKVFRRFSRVDRLGQSVSTAMT